MAEETTIENKIKFTEEGIDKVTKKIEKLGEGLESVASQADKIVEAFEKLGKTNIKVENFNKSQNKIQVGRSSMIWNPGSKKSSEQTESQRRKLDSLLQQEIENKRQQNIKLEKINQNYERILRQQQQELNNGRINAKARLENAKFKNSAENKRNLEANSAQREALYGFYKYKGEHPEEFVSNIHNAKYQLGNGLNNVGKLMSTTGIVGRLTGDSLSILGQSLKSPALGLGAAMTVATKAVKDFSVAATQSYAEIQSIQTNLGVVFPSQVQADAAFGDIAKYAVKSPFGVKETSELAILLKQSGTYATDLMDTLKMLGDTAGGNMEKMKRIANNYAQIVSIGKASMLDMRQFAYAGIPIFEAVSKELKVSQTELRKMISDGKVTSDIIEKVFKDLTGINGIFENATQKGAETLKARLQNLNDAKTLALAEMGEFGVNLGERTGKDSYALRGVGLAENIYQGIQKWANGKNIEHDINVISTRQDKIEELERLIEYNRNNGNEDLARTLEQALNKELGKRSLDAERATYASSYDYKKAAYDELIAQGKLFDENMIEEAAKRAAANLNMDSSNFNFNSFIAERNRILGNGEFANQSYLENKIKEIEKDQHNLKLANKDGSELIPFYGIIEMLKNPYKDASDEQIQSKLIANEVALEELTTALEALKMAATVTTTELKYYRERENINSQQSVYDTAGKKTAETGSALSYVSEIREAMSKTPEAQERALQEQRKNWENTISLMKEINGNLDNVGNLDITKLSYQQFSRYFNSGAIEAGRKLNIVNTEDKQAMRADRTILEAQYKAVNQEIEKQLSGDLKESFRNAFGTLSRAGRGLNDEDYLNVFNRTFDEQNKLLQKAFNNTEDKGQKELYENLMNYLKSVTIQWNGDRSVLNADIDQIMRSSGNVFIPLWKRILGSATGISPNVMSSTRETLDWYSNDVAIRNRTSGVLSSMLRTGGSVSDVQSLLKTSGSLKQLRGDTGGTYQIDWRATNKAVEDFALKLSSTTDVITAYKNGLQAEMDTYINLMSEGLTSAETQDLKNGKMISAKRYGELEKDYGSQLVNAFGEVLKSSEGLTVTVKDGKFIDERGNEIAQENVILTGNLFTVIESKMNELSGKIATASLQEANNQMLSKMVAGGKTAFYGQQLLSQTGTFTESRDITRFALENPEYLNSVMSAAINELIKNPKFQTNGKPLFKNENDVFMAANTSIDGRNKIALEMVNEALDEFYYQAGVLLKTTKNGSNILDLYENSDNYLADDKFLTDIANTSSKKNWFLGNYLGEEERKRIKDPDTSRKGMLENVLFGSNVLKEAGYTGDSTVKELAAYKGIEEGSLRAVTAQKALTNAIKEGSQALMDLAKTTSKSMFMKPFEAMGDSLITGNNALDTMKAGLKEVGAQMLQNMGATMADTGFKIAGAGALSKNWGMVAGGLALAAAGGFASGLGSAVTDAKNNTDNKDESAKLETLTDQLKKLLEQARSDALYYENNLRHKTALGTNKKFSYQSVNDMILTPHGNFSTAPDDYIIATKQPQALGTSKGPQVVTVQPVINPIVYNNSQAQVKQEQLVNDDGSIDVITYIEDAIADFIASPKGDEAFAARQARTNGRRSVM